MLPRLSPRVGHDATTQGDKVTQISRCSVLNTCKCNYVTQLLLPEFRSYMFLCFFIQNRTAYSILPSLLLCPFPSCLLYTCYIIELSTCQPITTHLMQKLLRWHVRRRDESHLTIIVLDMEVECVRPKGRQKLRYNLYGHHQKIY